MVSDFLGNSLKFVNNGLRIALNRLPIPLKGLNYIYYHQRQMMSQRNRVAVSHTVAWVVLVSRRWSFQNKCRRVAQRSVLYRVALRYVALRSVMQLLKALHTCISPARQLLLTVLPFWLV